MERGGDKIIYHREYSNGHITIYPDIIVVRFTNKYGDERLKVFRYNWVLRDADTIIVDGPTDTLYIYVDPEEDVIKYTELLRHEEGVGGNGRCG